MTTKLQELLEDLKSLKQFTINNALDYSLLETLITKYTETTHTYKPGDKVRVTGSLHSLNGQIFELLNKGQGLWQMENSEGRYWFEEKQFEPIN